MPTVTVSDIEPGKLTRLPKGGPSEPCPTCGARPNQRCVLPSGRVSPNTHLARGHRWAERMRTEWFIVRTDDEAAHLARTLPGDTARRIELLARIPDGDTSGRLLHLGEVEWLGFTADLPSAA